MGQGSHHEPPLPGPVNGRGTLSRCKESNVVLMVQDASAGALTDAALSSGALCCPSCTGRLRRWGFARVRIVRRRGLPALRLRPPRVRCSSCGGARVLLSASCLPRRCDEVATIGAALLAHVRGEGHRPIAVRLELPPDTVRGWLRRAQRFFGGNRAPWGAITLMTHGRLLAPGASNTACRRQRT